MKIQAALVSLFAWCMVASGLPTGPTGSISSIQMNGGRAPARNPAENGNQYLVYFNRETRDSFDILLEKHRMLLSPESGPGEFSIAGSTNAILHTYPSFGAYAVRLDKPEVLSSLMSQPEVQFVERDRVWYLPTNPEKQSPNATIKDYYDPNNGGFNGYNGGVQSATTTDPKPYSWGIDRLDGAIDSSYTYPSQGGLGVTVYVIDTGVNTQHYDFDNNRANWGPNFVSYEPAQDLHGHGTHCAGTVAGKYSGVAKRANVVAIKVMDAQGSGSTSSIIAAIQYVTQQHRQGTTNGRTVISMSIGGGYSAAYNQAIEAAVQAGVVMVVAAGNENMDACQGSPSSAQSAITVAAVDWQNTKASFSNWGSCVDINAPGVDINSSDFQRVDRLKTMSGTSMATPHVAGVAAILLSETQQLPIVPALVRQKMLSMSESGAMVGLYPGTPNQFLRI